MGNEELKGCHPGGDPVGLKGPDGYDTLSSYQAGKEDMITIIRAEIERRQKENYKQAGSFAAGRVVEDADILSFLSTIELEEYVELSSSVDNYPKNVCPPSVECEKGMREPLESEKPMEQDGLEEEIDRFEDWMETYNQADYPTSFTTRDIARHFAQWGAEHLKK